ncbi:MAG: hypothetical protein JWP30_91 [Homoserinimonas sp.]|nr:hypothetical protein [Homoserinimonas sp.]
MSNLAYALPERFRRGPAEIGTRTRHIEVVASRQQRNARPRLAYALIIVIGLFGVLVAQLLLSIALADGAYQISALQTQQKELSRDRQVVTEELNVLNSPQNLAARAESLGMVSNTSAVFLNLADGSVMGAPAAATAGAGSVVGENGSLLIPNSLLPADIAGMERAAKPEPVTQRIMGAPVAPSSAGSVASSAGGIPAPVTR